MRTDGNAGSYVQGISLKLITRSPQHLQAMLGRAGIVSLGPELHGLLVCLWPFA